jgi:hypothetical protein
MGGGDAGNDKPRFLSLVNRIPIIIRAINAEIPKRPQASLAAFLLIKEYNVARFMGLVMDR